MLLRSVLQDALSDVTKIHPPLKLTVFVDDITAFCDGEKQREVADMVQKVMEELKKRWKEKQIQIVSDRRWEGNKMRDDCVVWLPGK